MPQIVEHLEAVVGGLDTPPILIGHSAGGVFTQILLDHGFGAAGVAINSAPTEGVQVVPLSQVKVDLPGAQEPGQPPPGGRLHRSSSGTTRSPTPSREEESQPAVRALPHPGVRRASSGAACWPTSTPATRTPGSTTTTTTARRCCSSPAARTTSCRRTIQQSNAKHYKSDTITEVKEFDGPHLLPARDGLGGGRRLRARLGARSTPRSAERGVSGVRLTHVGGPTVLIEVGGWRLLTDPTFDAPGRRYALRLGHVVAQARRAGGRRRATSAPIDAVLLTHDHHADNLDDAGPRAAAVGRRRRDHGVGRAAARRRHAAGSRRGRRRASRRRAGRRSRSPRRRAGTARRVQPSDRRRRHRLRAALGGPGARRAVDLRRHRALRRRARGRRAGARSARRCCTSAACASRSPGRCATR